MKTTKERKTKKAGNFWGPVFLLLIGAACGLVMSSYLKSISAAELPLGQHLAVFGLLLLGIYAAYFLHIILHEAGHLVFGLLTGYRYSSFRIGNYVWVKEHGKLKLRRMSLAGTGGQCLMRPPEMIDGKMPFVLYNLGGPLMNIIAALISLCLSALLRGIPFLRVFFQMMSIIGFGAALLNGIPMRLGPVNNDGRNALSLGKNRDALRSFWVQMTVNDQGSQGVRLKDMPEEWFAVPTDEAMKNDMTAVMAVLAENRLMDLHLFEEAKELADKLFSKDAAIVGLHRRLMACDRIFCELIGGKADEVLKKLRTVEQLGFMKQMKNFPAVIRTEYAYALLAEGDAAKARQFKEQFERRAPDYPYAGDIESERELMTVAEKAAGL